MTRPSKQKVLADLAERVRTGEDATDVLTSALRYGVPVPYRVYLVAGRIKLRERDAHGT